ncbi:DUF1624 domain-containing protein [Pendulispora albinea]|uniref:Heparan-alpha-glucosaminide N-acetyltransferase domain-containing protein n=1 Tax=Pendulispora albinea TaxID=2741071 RepID=A0ABZ2M7N5_9BACT
MARMMDPQVETRQGPPWPDQGERAPAEARPIAKAEARPIAKAARVDAVDLLRGVVMIVMAIDHSRDFFSGAMFDPTDLKKTTPALFFTRIVTHICAPTFMLLAGTGAYLSLSRGKSRAEVSRFLWTRGLALVIAEETIMRIAWRFKLYGLPIDGSTMWGLGWSMIALSALIHLPIRGMAVVGAAMVLFHNLLDSFTGESWGPLRFIWVFLHGGFVGTPERPILWVGYSLIPWAGVMALGYAMGPIVRGDPARRRRFFFYTGLSLTFGFMVLRFTNVYGDRHPWSPQASPILTVMSFLTTEKYPPSLLFLTMTLGPMLLLLSALDGLKGRVANWLLIYGRVPLFYYLAHIFLLHIMAFVLAYAVDKPLPWTPAWALSGPPIANYGWDLPMVYLMWLAAVAALYPACKWYMGLKRRSSFWLLGYL